MHHGRPEDEVEARRQRVGEVVAWSGVDAVGQPSLLHVVAREASGRSKTVARARARIASMKAGRHSTASVGPDPRAPPVRTAWVRVLQECHKWAVCPRPDRHTGRPRTRQASAVAVVEGAIDLCQQAECAQGVQQSVRRARDGPQAGSYPVRRVRPLADDGERVELVGGEQAAAPWEGPGEVLHAVGGEGIGLAGGGVGSPRLGRPPSRYPRAWRSGNRAHSQARLGQRLIRCSGLLPGPARAGPVLGDGDPAAPLFFVRGPGSGR